jgi:hypothetical protein
MFASQLNDDDRLCVPLGMDGIERPFLLITLQHLTSICLIDIYRVLVVAEDCIAWYFVFGEIACFAASIESGMGRGGCVTHLCGLIQYITTRTHANIKKLFYPSRLAASFGNTTVHRVVNKSSKNTMLYNTMSSPTSSPLTIYGILVGRQDSQEWNVSIANQTSIDLRDLVRPWPVQVPDRGELSGNANVDFDRFPVRVASANQQKFADCPATELYKHYVKFGKDDMSNFLERLGLGYLETQSAQRKQESVYMWLPVMNKSCSQDDIRELFGIEEHQQSALRTNRADCTIEDLINSSCHRGTDQCDLSGDEAHVAHRKMLGAYGLYNHPDQLKHRIAAAMRIDLEGVEAAIDKQLADAQVKIQLLGRPSRGGSIDMSFGGITKMSAEEIHKLVAHQEKRLGQHDHAIGSRPNRTSEHQPFSIA